MEPYLKSESRTAAGRPHFCPGWCPTLGGSKRSEWFGEFGGLNNTLKILWQETRSLKVDASQALSPDCYRKQVCQKWSPLRSDQPFPIPRPNISHAVVEDVTTNAKCCVLVTRHCHQYTRTSVVVRRCKWKISLTGPRFVRKQCSCFARHHAHSSQFCPCYSFWSVLSLLFYLTSTTQTHDSLNKHLHTLRVQLGCPAPGVSLTAGRVINRNVQGKKRAHKQMYFFSFWLFRRVNLKTTCTKKAKLPMASSCRLIGQKKSWSITFFSVHTRSCLTNRLNADVKGWSIHCE